MNKRIHINEGQYRLLVETHINKLYHFVTPKQLKYIFKNGFKLNDSESSYSISPKLPKFLSFSRNRNGVQGFPFMNTDYVGGGGTIHYSGESWLLVRIEIDGEKLNRYGKVKPFDYINHFNDEEEQDLNQGYYVPTSSKEEIANMAKEYPNLDSPSDAKRLGYKRTEMGQEVYNQPFSQSEERLFSKLKRIPKDEALKLITRIDVYVNDSFREEAIEFYKFASWLDKQYLLFKELGIGLYYYDDINNFNLQTNKLMKDWKWDYYYECYRDRNKW